MTSINRLTNKPSLEDKDLIPVWDAESGRTRNIAAESLKDYIPKIQQVDSPHLVSGTYSAGTLTLDMSDGTKVDVSGWTDLTGINFKEDGSELGMFRSVNFMGSGVQAARQGDDLEVTIKTAAVAPTLALQFSGIYDDLQSLKDSIPSPTDNQQAIALKPSEKYYHGVGGSWVELAPVGSFHPNYLGAYDTVDDLKAAEPSPADDSLAIVGTTAKSFYIYTSGDWSQVTHTDLPSIDARLTDNEAKTKDNTDRIQVAEGHLQTLQQQDQQHDNQISAIGQDITQLQGRKVGIDLENEDGSKLSDLTSLKLNGSEIVDNGDGTYTLRSASQITVADGQGIGSKSFQGNALIFDKSQISVDPNDSNVIRIGVHAASHDGINVGDGVNSSRDVQTILFNGHQAYGSGTTAEIHLEFAHFKTLTERNAWSAKFGSKMNFDVIALVDSDENGFVQFYKFTAATKQWSEYNAQGVIMSDSNGAIPKNIKTVVFGPGFAIQQAGDQEDAALVTYTPAGDDHSHAAELSIAKSYGDYKTVDKVSNIELFYPLEVNDAMAGPGQISPGYATLSIDPDAYEPQHGKSCLVKLDMVTAVAGQHPHAIYMSEEVVPTGMYFSLNQQNKGVDVQDNTGGDTAVTGGQMTEALVKLSFTDVAPDDGNVKVWLQYKDPSDPIAKEILVDVNGNPLAVEKQYKSGDAIGDFILAGAFMAKATETLKVVVETSFDADNAIALDPMNTMLCLNQFGLGYETSIARIEFLRRAAIQITPAIQKFNSTMLSLSDEIRGITGGPTTITAGTGDDTLNEFGIQNLTDVSVEFQNGTMTVKDVGNIADFYVDTLIDNTHTRMLRGKTVTSSITIANPNNAFEFEAYSWNGKPDHVNKVYSRRNNGSIVLNVGWQAIKTIFVAEQPGGNSFGHTLSFTVPDSANNILILVRPQVPVSPNTLILKGFDWGASEFTGYVEIERYNEREEHLRFDESYAEYLYTNEGYASTRYTISNTPVTGNPMPVGKLAKGKAPVERDGSVNQVPGSQLTEYDGAIKFTKDGEASISKSYNVWNEQSTDNTVTFWDVLIDVDGNESKIPESERTFTIPANTGAPGVVYSIPAYAVDVEAGQRVGGRATSNKADGAYVQSQNISEYLVQTVIDFKELVITNSDDPILVSAPLQKALVEDKRVYSFTGNTLQNLVIDLDIPSDVELAEIEVVKHSGTKTTSIKDCEYSYDSSTKKLTVHVGSAVAEGKIYLTFWSAIA